jgi:hypothetical protein
MNRHLSKTNQLYASNDQIDNNGNNILNNNNNNKLSNAADYNSSNYDRDDSLYDALSFGKQTPFGMDSNNSNTNNNNNNNANYNNQEHIDDFDSESQDDEFENNSSNNEDLNRGITELEDQTNLEHMNRYSLVDLEYINGDVNYSQDEIENNDNQDIPEIDGQDDRHDVASNNAKTSNNDTSNNFNSIIKMQDANKTNDLMNTSIDEIILIADNGNDLKQERTAVGNSQSKIPTPIRQNSNRSSTFCKL